MNINKMTKIVLDCILQPEYINKDYKTHILNFLQEKYTYKSLKQGYIVKIHKIIDIIHNYIDYNYNLCIKTLCETEIIRLIKDIELNDCEITMIHNNGIFVIKHTIKILIPNNDNNKFEYNNNSCEYNKRVYNCGDKIDIIIQDVRFEKNEYTCIGIFKD
jgi:DNA-directed RNA polymerase subunit E'/Rpb7